MKAKKKPIDEKTPEGARRRCRAAAPGDQGRRSGGRKAGVKVGSVADIVGKLKNEAGVI